jgi:hypothetical protein
MTARADGALQQAARLVQIELQLAVNSRLARQQLAHRRAARMATVLGTVAGALAAYDLLLLALASPR